MPHPTLVNALCQARSYIELGQGYRDAQKFQLTRAAFNRARHWLLQALAIAKTLKLQAVVARVLLALREVGKAQRQVEA